MTLLMPRAMEAPRGGAAPPESGAGGDSQAAYSMRCSGKTHLRNWTESLEKRPRRPHLPRQAGGAEGPASGGLAPGRDDCAADAEQGETGTGSKDGPRPELSAQDPAEGAAREGTHELRDPEDTERDAAPTLVRPTADLGRQPGLQEVEAREEKQHAGERLPELCR